MSDLDALRAQNDEVLERATKVLGDTFDQLVAACMLTMVSTLRDGNAYAAPDPKGSKGTRAGSSQGANAGDPLPPTASAACLALCTEVRNLVQVVRLPTSMGGSNAERFLGELSLALASAVRQAATGKSGPGIDAAGAIRLKVDIAELGTFCATEVSAAAAPAWDELGRLSNALIVPPAELQSFAADTFGPQLAEPMAPRVEEFFKARADVRAGTVSVPRADPST